MNALLQATLTFVGAELVPTLLALLAAAASEPMSWGVAAAALAARGAWRCLNGEHRS